MLIVTDQGEILASQDIDHGYRSTYIVCIIDHGYRSTYIVCICDTLELSQVTVNMCTCVKHVGITAHGQNIGDKIKDGESVGTDNC